MIKKEKFPDCVFLAVIRYLVSCVCVRETVTWDSSVSLCESNRRGDERAHDSVMKSKNERLTVCTECNLISSCICIQSLCITHTLWCSAGYRICMKCMMSCGAGSDPLIDPLTGNWVPTAQTWLSLSSPPTSVLVASRRCSNMRGEIWTYSAHTHTHTCGVLTVCVVFVCSTELKCKMKFAVYLPPKAETDKCPVLYWLSGECGHDAAAHNFYLLHQHHVWSQEDNSHWGPTCPHDLYKEINTTSRGRDEGRVLWAEDRDCSQR